MKISRLNEKSSDRYIFTCDFQDFQPFGETVIASASPWAIAAKQE
jgi:hypothetical protein